MFSLGNKVNVRVVLKNMIYFVFTVCFVYQEPNIEIDTSLSDIDLKAGLNSSSPNKSPARSHVI